jgi:hypothetical protein
MRLLFCLLLVSVSLLSLGCPGGSSKGVNKDYDRPKPGTTATTR